MMATDKRLYVICAGQRSKELSVTFPSFLRHCTLMILVVCWKGVSDSRVYGPAKSLSISSLWTACRRASSVGEPIGSLRKMIQV